MKLMLMALLGVLFAGSVGATSNVVGGVGTSKATLSIGALFYAKTQFGLRLRLGHSEQEMFRDGRPVWATDAEVFNFDDDIIVRFQRTVEANIPVENDDIPLESPVNVYESTCDLIARDYPSFHCQPAMEDFVPKKGLSGVGYQRGDKVDVWMVVGQKP